jgi:Domain of unknown function (DUF1083).
MVFGSQIFAHDLTFDCIGGTAVIDGVKEAAWDKAKSIDVKAWGGDEGAWATVYSMYDTDYVYFFAVITDKVIDVSAEDPGDGSHRDCIGFCMDFSYLRSNGTDHINFQGADFTGFAGYVNYGADGNSYYNYSLNQDSFKNNTVFKTVLTDTGYDVEVKFPIKSFGFTEGSKMGIEFFINDAIGEGQRFTYANWETSGVDSWQYTDTMGTLVFGALAVAETEAPVVETEAPAVEAPTTESTAPQTSDTAIAIGLAAIVTAAAIAISRKHVK